MSPNVHDGVQPLLWKTAGHHHFPYTCRTLVAHLPYTYRTLVAHLPYTCRTLAAHLAYTCCTLAVHLPYTCSTLVIHLQYTCRTLAVHLRYTFGTALCGGCITSPSVSWPNTSSLYANNRKGSARRSRIVCGTHTLLQKHPKSPLEAPTLSSRSTQTLL